ncbi:MAG: rhodanese-like domain-containing protein [Gemmatimonadaceae bacterium]
MFLHSPRASLVAGLASALVSFAPSSGRAHVVLPACTEAPSANVPHHTQPSSLIVSPTDLARELRDPALVLLHVGPKDDYDAGHIAGARYVDMSDLSTPHVEGQLMLELPDAATLRQRLETLGISDNSRIVVIPGKDWASPATRVVFTLQAAGLGARTRLLDGGSDGWKRAKLPVTTTHPAAAKPGHLTLAGDRSIVVDHAWIQSKIGAPGIRIIDARAPVFYEGAGMKDNRGMNHTAGHIPSAKNIPFNTVMDDSLKLLPAAELRKMFAAAGVQPGDTVAAYCHIGQQATAVVFAARSLGIPVRLYDGSFTDWEERKLPIENSKAPKGEGH